MTVYWGDVASSTITDGNTGTTTHEYASAGTYAIQISNPSVITVFDVRDSKLVINSANLHLRASGLTHLWIQGIHVTSVINSADFAGSTPSSYLLFSLPAGVTGVINSADFAGSTPSSYLYFFLPAGVTGVINSADFAGSTPSSYLYFTLPAGVTGAINSADFAGSTPSTYLRFILPVGVTMTVARADFATMTTAPAVRIEANLLAAQVDAILLGLHDAFASKSAPGGTIDLLGGGNAAPNGTVEAPGDCDVGTWTGGNAAHELANDTCDVSANHWTSVTVQA